MPRYAVTATIEAEAQRVWDLLSDWEGSEAWMVDATTVRVVGDRREGPGTRVEAVTRKGVLSLVDVMTVRTWDPPRLMVVEHHRRPLRGIAWFELAPVAGARTRLEWVEEVDPPLGPLGELGGSLLRQPIESLLRASLRKLKTIAERAV